jgi:cleavage and polyadenylation specificity factor subunit 1
VFLFFSSEIIALDFVGPLPVTVHRNRYDPIITCCFSRWPEVYALPDTSAESVAVGLADWCCRYGAPLSLVSDRGSAFLNQVISAYSRMWNINQFHVAAYHPAANGLVERFNGTLVDMLRVYSLETGSLWDETLIRLSYFLSFWY